MSSVALLSCLGVPGWAPLHWLVPVGGEPDALLQRLRRSWCQASGEHSLDPRPARVLASLLRNEEDWRPVAALLLVDLAEVVRFRHRLRARPGQRWLQLRSWERPGDQPLWRCCGPERALDPSRLSPGPSRSP